jgi:hypothetical protein
MAIDISNFVGNMAKFNNDLDTTISGIVGILRRFL